MNMLTGELEKLDAPTAPGRSVPRNTRRAQRYLMVVGIVAALAWAFWLGFDSSQPLRLEAANLKFGKVWASSAFPWTVELSNSAPYDITIAQFEASCACTTVSPETLTIRAGSKASIKLTLNLHSGTAGDSGLMTRPFRVSIGAIASHRPDTVKRWTVEGEVMLPFEPPSGEFHFDKPLRQGLSFPSATVVVTPAILAKTVRATCDSRNGSVSVERLPSTSNSYSVTVTPGTTLPMGRFSFPVALTVEDRDGKALPPYTMLATGEIVDDIYLLPNHVDFGLVVSSQSTTQSVALESYSSTHFAVKSIKTTLSGVSAATELSAMSVRHTVNLSGRFSKLGPVEGMVNMTLVTSDAKTVVLNIPIRAYVIAAKS